MACSLFLSRSKRHSFYPECQNSPRTHLASCSVDVGDPFPALKQLMHLAVTQLYFVLWLQISAVVSVLPLYVFMVYTGTTLSSTVVLEEWLQYLHGHNSAQ